MIIASILLALALDAWIAERERQAQERVELRALRTDFSRQIEALKRLQSNNDVKLEKMRLLLANAAKGAAVPVPVVDSAVRALINAPSFDPGATTMESLLASGRLSLIHDFELRAALVEWQGVVDEVKDNELLLREFVRQSVVPYLAARHAPLGRAFSTHRDWPAPPLDPATAEERYNRILSDPEFEALLSYRFTWTLGSREEYEQAIGRAERILELLDEYP